LEELLNEMNYKIKLVENTTKLVKIQESFGNSISLLQPRRVFIREGETKLEGINSAKYLFLFNDCLLLARKSFVRGLLDWTAFGPTYSLEDRISLCTVTISSPTTGTVFDLVTTNIRYTFIFDTIEERNSWIRDIHNQITTSMELEAQIPISENIVWYDIKKVCGNTPKVN